MYITTPGLVLRETEYKESSRILTVLTASNGKLTVRAQGAKRRGSKTAAGITFQVGIGRVMSLVTMATLSPGLTMP